MEPNRNGGDGNETNEQENEHDEATEKFLQQANGSQHTSVPDGKDEVDLAMRFGQKKVTLPDGTSRTETCAEIDLPDVLVGVALVVVGVIIVAALVTVVTLVTRKTNSEPPTDYKQTIRISGAHAEDSRGIAAMEYLPRIDDNTATFEAPDKLTLSKDSVNKNYTVSVETRDIDDNAAECKYYISVKEDTCVPWNLPDEQNAEKEEEKTSEGWKVTYRCLRHPDDPPPHPVSYHYLDNTATFTCTSGMEFTSEKRFSCQRPSVASYSYVTSLKYQYLNGYGTKLDNITEDQASICFSDFYRKELFKHQEKMATSLESEIKEAASTFGFSGLSPMELLVQQPRALELTTENGRVHEVRIGIGYEVGPPNYAFPTNSFNTFVRGTLRREHNTLLPESMEPFRRLKGNIAARCPDLQAPVESSLFREISSGFDCNDGEKQRNYYDENMKEEITVCLGCPVGEFYNRDSGSCEECALNTYQDVVGAMECKLCPLNRKTEKTGARTIDDCVPL